ncbi:unnamed protein product [Boreogadus saida]
MELAPRLLQGRPSGALAEALVLALCCSAGLTGLTPFPFGESSTSQPPTAVYTAAQTQRSLAPAIIRLGPAKYLLELTQTLTARVDKHATLAEFISVLRFKL